MTDLDHYPKPDRDCECGDCDWTGRESEIKLSVFECDDLSERLTVGHPLPAGACPACGSWAYVVTPYSRCQDAALDLLTALEVCEIALANLGIATAPFITGAISSQNPKVCDAVAGTSHALTETRAAIAKARGRA